MSLYYQDQEHDINLYCGNCEDVIPHIQFDYIVSDPPYGINHPTDYATRKKAWKGLAKRNDYPRVFNDDKPFDPGFLLKLNKPMVLFGANYFSDKLPPSSGWIVWDKQRPPTLDQATCEIAWSNYVKGVRIFHHLWNGCMKASERGENYHPTQKPIELMKWILSLKWNPKGAVLDPYAGSGSTLLAAKQLGIPAIGIEYSEAYCEIIARRLDKCPILKAA